MKKKRGGERTGEEVTESNRKERRGESRGGGKGKEEKGGDTAAVLGAVGRLCEHIR